MKWLERFNCYKSPTPEEFQAVTKLCEREYWDRMWVLQEFGLADDITVRCGSKCVSGRAFTLYCMFIMERPSLRSGKPYVPEKLAGTLTLSNSNSAHTSIKLKILCKSYSVATLEALEALLSKNYVRIVALGYDL
jgi:hypothetical protein